MDLMQRYLVKNLTAWDLNCKKYVKLNKSAHKLYTKFVRTARRKMKQDINKRWG